jgi:hypothetical protein
MDKLTVLNNALVNTSNNMLNALNDGSDEWIVANQGFGRAIKFLMARHNWPFAKAGEEMVRLPDANNKSQRFRQNCFRLPDFLHLIEVYHAGAITTNYEVLGTVLSSPYDSQMFAEGVRMPADAIWHPMAEEVLTLYVEAACLRGLNEDFTAADKREEKAENLLFEARPRADQVNPARNMYKSAVRQARMTRRV